MRIKFYIIFVVLFSNLLCAQTPAYISKDSLIGWWPFNGNANDLSGKGNNGNLLKGVSYTKDRYSVVNSAVQIDGVDGLGKGVEIPANVKNTGVFSISCWFQILDSIKTVNTSSQCILSTNPHTLFAVGYSHPYYPKKMGSCIGDGTNWLSCSSNGIQWNLNQKMNWHHLVVVKSLNNFKYYVDGALSYTHISNASYNKSSFSILLGAINTSTGEVFNGKIDDLAIWNRLLDSNEIQKIFNSVNCKLSITREPNDNAAASGNVSFVLKTNDNTAQFQWQTNQGTGWQNLNDAGQYIGVNKDSIVVRNIVSNNDAQLFRCIVTGDCGKDTSRICKLNVWGVGSKSFGNNKISIYPNPSKGLIWVTGNLSCIEGYSVYSIDGRLMTAGLIKSEIDVSSLLEGIYILKIQSDIFKIVKE